jgi:hypothetical protein
MDGMAVLIDGLWIAALAIMSSTSRQAYGRMRPTARVPMQFDHKGAPLWRASRLIGVSFTPALATVLWLGLLVAGQTAPEGSLRHLILLGARLFPAPIFALVHLWHLRQALKVLGAEGQLKP